MRKITSLILIIILSASLLTSCRDSLETSLNFSKAKTLYDQEKYDEAISCYDKIINSNQRLDSAYTGKADALLALDRLEEAVEYCDKAITLNENKHLAYNIKGDALSDLGKYDEALESYEEAARLSPSDSVYQNNIAYVLNYLERYDEAIEYCEKALKLNRKNDMAYVNKGYALDSLGKFDEAVECYDKAIELNPSNNDAHNNRAYTLNNLGRFDEAIAAYDKALEVEPDDLDAMNNKGDSFISQGEYSEALECFENVIKKDPQNSYAHISKAVSLYYSGEYKESIEACDKLIKIDSSSIDAYVWKAKNYIQLDDLLKAHELCDKSLAIDQNSPFAYDVKGLAYLYDYNYVEAINQFEASISKDEHYEDAYIHKIYTLYTLKNFSRCIEFSKKAAEIFPSNEDIPWYIADCYSTQLESENALEYYEKTLAINPDNYEVMTSIAWEHYYLQNYEKAAEYIEKTLELYPKYDYALQLKQDLETEKLPEAEKIVNLVKENYLYFDKVRDFEKLSQQFMSDEDVTVDDISEFINDIRLKDDMYTFVIHGEDYDLLKYEESTSQIASAEIDPTTFYIRINLFTPSVSWEFKKAIDGISNTEDKVLVIDLRDNPGGLTSASNDILDFLLPECTTSYIVYRDGGIYSYYSDKTQIKFKKIMVLVNEYSASSSEVLALGLQKYLDNVVIIGRPTAGKGVGQYVYEDKTKKYMIFLVSFYWNVKEKNIMGEKINPDVYVRGTSDSSYLNEVKRQAAKQN